MAVREFAEGIPIPVCGLALGLASLDRYLSSNYGSYQYGIFAAISTILVLLFVLKMTVGREAFRKDIESPILFGVLPTFPMTLMILSTYIVDTLEMVAQMLWIVSLASMFVMMFLFLRRFLVGFRIKNVFPSWFVMFIGCVVASVTSVAIGFADIGKTVFIFGVVAYAVLLPLISYRVLIKKGIPEQAMPNLAIFTAPPNLLLVGYLAAFGTDANETVVLIWAVFGIISYFMVLAYLPFMMRRKFYVSYGAFTFPLVISMMSINSIGEFFDLSGGLYGILEKASEAIAVAMVVYVLIRYVAYFIGIATEKSKTGT